MDDVFINLKSSKDLDLPRETLTNTIGHKIGHAKWNERQMEREFYMEGIDDYYIKNYTPSERMKIKKYAGRAFPVFARNAVLSSVIP